MTMSQASYEALAALGLGLTFAGLLASGFEWASRRPIGVRLLQSGGIGALASVPLLVFSAPVLILRATIEPASGRGRGFRFAFAATLLAGFWSLLCGRLLFDAAQRLSGA